MLAGELLGSMFPLRKDQMLCSRCLRVGEDLCNLTALGNLALTDDGHPVTDFFDHAHFMRDNYNGDSQTAVDIL